MLVRKIFAFFILILFPVLLSALPVSDFRKTVMYVSATDTARWKKLEEKVLDNLTVKNDSATAQATRVLKQATRAASPEWMARGNYLVGIAHYYGKRYTECQPYVTRCIEASPVLQDEEVLAEAMYTLGMSYYQLEKNEESAEWLKKAVPHFKNTGNEFRQGLSLMYTGNAFYNTKANDQAKEYYQASLILFNKLKKTYYAGDVHYNLGRIYYFRDHAYRDALSEFKEAAALYEENEDEKYNAYCNFYIGEIGFYYIPDYANAIPAYETALAWYRKKEDRDKIASVQKNLGDMYNARNDYDKAILALDDCISILETDKVNEGLGNAYIAKANIVYFRGDYPNALQLYKKSMDAYEKENSLDGMAGSYVGMGNLYYARGDDKKSLEMFTKSLEYYEKAGGTHLSGISSAYTGLGNIYYARKEYDKAREYYEKGIEKDEKAGNVEGKIVKLMNLSNIYVNQKDYLSAENYLKEAARENEKIGNKHRQASILNLMGFFYLKQKEYEKAIEECSKALTISEELGLLPETKDNYSCLYSATYYLGNYQNALDYYIGYISARDSIANEKRNSALTKQQLQFEYEKKQAVFALEREKEELALREEINRKQLLFRFEKEQAAMRAETEKKEIAYHEDMKRKQLAMEFEKQQSATRLKSQQEQMKLRQDIAQRKIQNEAQKKQLYGLLAGLSVMCILAFFIYRGYREKRKANNIIVRQKQEVELQKEEITRKSLLLEEKNKEIVDSINYAKRLQEAILPPLKLVRNYFGDSFVLYKPKDIVAGDFYFMETVKIHATTQGSVREKAVAAKSARYTETLSIPEEPREIIVLAAADCTGHGVPGAMVSVVCSNALTRSVKEFGLTDPGRILDKTRELVIETFQKSESEVKDGMDISLAALELRMKNEELKMDDEKSEIASTSSQKPVLPLDTHQTSNLKPQIHPLESSIKQEELKTGEAKPATRNSQSATVLRWAGANNPLWILRKEATEIEEIRADKQPIGVYDSATPFATHEVVLSPGDSIYMFTDGYADQFGGEKGKKFKSSNMKTLLLQVRNESMEYQHKTLDEYFEKWKAGLEQIDDVCMVGIRIS